MVHSFVERLRAQDIAGVIHENSVEVRTDSQNRLIGLLANKEWKLFEQSAACGIFLIRIRVQSGEGYIPILHQRGAVITLN